MGVEESFIGGRFLNGWYCCACLDDAFGLYISDHLSRDCSFGLIEAVYEVDEWVQDKTCVLCHGRFDTAP